MMNDDKQLDQGKQGILFYFSASFICSDIGYDMHTPEIKTFSGSKGKGMGPGGEFVTPGDGPGIFL